MKEKLQECLDIVEDICCDVTEEYPIGCVRVRYLLREVLAQIAASEPTKVDALDDDDRDFDRDAQPTDPARFPRIALH